MDMYVRAAYGAGRPDTRAFFSRFTQGASAKTLLTIRRARSDTGKITEKCSIAGGWIELPLSSLHAMPDLRGPNSQPARRPDGFISMLRRLRTEYPAQYSACIFDAKGKTFREDLYPAYKAHRPAMPAELA